MRTRRALCGDAARRFSSTTGSHSGRQTMRNQRLCRFSTARATRLISSASEAFRTQGQLHHAGKDSWQRAETTAWPLGPCRSTNRGP